MAGVCANAGTDARTRGFACECLADHHDIHPPTTSSATSRAAKTYETHRLQLYPGNVRYPNHTHCREAHHEIAPS